MVTNRSIDLHECPTTSTLNAHLLLVRQLPLCWRALSLALTPCYFAAISRHRYVNTTLANRKHQHNNASRLRSADDIHRRVRDAVPSQKDHANDICVPVLRNDWFCTNSTFNGTRCSFAPHGQNTHWIAELLKLLTGASALCVTLGGLEICSA